MGASVLLPLGFFLGGVRFHAGDPGVGVALAPLGAALLLTAVWRLARGIRTTASPTASGPPRPRKP